MKTDGATGPSGGENRFQNISVDIFMVFWLYSDILLVGIFRGNFTRPLGFNNLKSAPNLKMVVRSRGEKEQAEGTKVDEGISCGRRKTTTGYEPNKSVKNPSNNPKYEIQHPGWKTTTGYKPHQSVINHRSIPNTKYNIQNT